VAAANHVTPSLDAQLAQHFNQKQVAFLEYVEALVERVIARRMRERRLSRVPSYKSSVPQNSKGLQPRP
jgi:hypothetical protein